MADIPRRLALEIADNWEQMSGTENGSHAARRETLRECADLIRMMADRTLPDCAITGAPAAASAELRVARAEMLARLCAPEDRRELAIALLRASQEPPHDDPDPWLLRYSDPARTDELFTGPGAEAAARARFEIQRCSWTCTLFKGVAHG